MGRRRIHILKMDNNVATGVPVHQSTNTKDEVQIV